MPLYTYKVRLSDDAKMTQAKWKKLYKAEFDYNRFSTAFSCEISIVLNGPSSRQVLWVRPRVGSGLIIQDGGGATVIVSYKVTEVGETPEAAFWHAYTVLGVNLGIW
jgi:hypothetical protein